MKRETPAESFLTIHRSVQEGLLQKLNHDTAERSEAFGCALEAVRRVVPRPSVLLQAEPDKWYKLERHLPQLLSLRRAYARSSPRISGLFEFAEMLFDVGMNMWDRGLTKEGQEVLRTAEEVLDDINYPAETTIRANIHIVLAIIVEDVGISSRLEALERRKKAYAIRKSIFDTKGPTSRTLEDGILLFAALVDLARSYQQSNNFEEVKAICDRAYKQYKEWGDDSVIPFEYSKYWRLLAFASAYAGDTATAVAYSQRAARLQARADPTALLANMFKFDWILMLFQDERWEEGTKQLESLHGYREEHCGKNNHLTLQSGLCLGIAYYRQGNYLRAE